jgi:hypothetical protein
MSDFGRIYQIGKIQKRVSIVRVSPMGNVSIGLIMLGIVKIVDLRTTDRSHSTGREYSSLPVMGFNQYVSCEYQTRWYSNLDNSFRKWNGQFQICFSTVEPVDVLEDMGLDISLYPGVMPASQSNCDPSTHGITFIGQKSRLFQPRTWTSQLFYVSLPALTKNPRPKHRVITTPHYSGRISLPVFSADGRSLAFLREEDQNKVVSKNHIFVVDNICRLHE